MMRKTPVLIETVRVRSGRAPLWYLHLRRLAASAAALGIPFPRALDIPGGGADRVERLAVALDKVEVTTREVGPVAPVRLVTSRVVHEPYPHKTTDRRAFSEALRQARATGADDAILYTASGFAAEGSIWCLFWWEAEGLGAPALELGVLPGVSRFRIEELHGAIAGRRVRRGELGGLPLFVANAVRGVVPVASLDGQAVPRDPRTEGLGERFWT